MIPTDPDAHWHTTKAVTVFVVCLVNDAGDFEPFGFVQEGRATPEIEDFRVCPPVPAPTALLVDVEKDWLSPVGNLVWLYHGRPPWR